MSNQLISGEYFYKGRINYFLVKCHIYQGNKQIYNQQNANVHVPLLFCLQCHCLLSMAISAVQCCVRLKSQSAVLCVH